MSNPFVAEIRIFPFNFAPTGWALCNGQLMPLSQNTALFSLLGTTYGGNGQSNFALPDLQGSAPMFFGQGPGLSQHFEGEAAGSDTITLLNTEMPSHTHLLQANTSNATSPSANGNVYAKGLWSFAGDGGAVATYTVAAPDVQLNPQAAQLTGGGQPHNNMMPYLTLNFAIALQGVFPQRP